jgi:DNA replication protein DnaC
MLSSFYCRLPLSPTPLHLSIDPASMERALIGRDYWRVNPDEIPDGLPYKQSIVKYAQSINKCEERGFGLYLYGPLGTGKTALAVIALKAAIIRGGTALLMTASEIQRAYTARTMPTLSNGATVEEGLVNVQFLAIDDFGAEDQKTDWKQQHTELVIRARQRDRLPTIITSNIAPKDLPQDWLKSILNKHFMILNVAGKDWRTRES